MDSVEREVEEAKGCPLRLEGTERDPVEGSAVPVGTGEWSTVPAAEAAALLVASFGLYD
jgi:hypothetical protein